MSPVMSWETPSVRIVAVVTVVPTFVAAGQLSAVSWSLVQVAPVASGLPARPAGRSSLRLLRSSPPAPTAPRPVTSKLTVTSECAPAAVAAGLATGLPTPGAAAAGAARGRAAAGGAGGRRGGEKSPKERHRAQKRG